jgi:hypothetical protein
VFAERVSLQNFIFSKKVIHFRSFVNKLTILTSTKVALGFYAGGRQLPPAALVSCVVLCCVCLFVTNKEQVADRSRKKDKRRTPLSGERVRYVVVHGAPSAPLY